MPLLRLRQVGSHSDLLQVQSHGCRRRQLDRPTTANQSSIENDWRKKSKEKHPMTIGRHKPKMLRISKRSIEQADLPARPGSETPHARQLAAVRMGHDSRLLEGGIEGTGRKEERMKPTS